MKSLKTSLIMGAALLALTACADRYNEAASVTPAGDSFSQELYDGYITLSKMERDEVDYKDSDLFADKAIKAAMGEPVSPENLNNWAIEDAYLGDLLTASNSLGRALSEGGAKAAPQDMAIAQVMFDCWVQEQEENIQPDHIAKCRGDFESAMLRVKGAMAPPIVKAVAPAPEPIPAPKPELMIPGPYDIYFDFDSSKLSGDSGMELDVIAETIKKLEPARVVLIGHTDTAGDSEYNLDLSMKRVNTVGAGLAERGIPAAVVKSMVRGEMDPAVPTGDNVIEIKNRRVHILLEK